jgi:hypothetical protein
LGRRIKIVVGEGRTAQQGLLRFVLEGEGFEVARETRTIADLAIAVAEEQPDVVVLDDGIGVVAVSMVHEAVPQTKIVLVWPSAVVPIGGDARVEPAKILGDLGPAVRQVVPVGVGAGVTESFERPEWIDKIRKDPATLRDKLSASTTETTKRPSVTQLQKRGRRLHPGRRPGRRKGAEEAAPAAVVALPLHEGASGGTGPGADVVAADGADEPSEWNRRLGTLALSGAAAVSALVLALAIGGGSLPPTLRGSEVSLPPGVEFGQGNSPVGQFIGGLFGGTDGGEGVLQIPTVDVDEGTDGNGGGTGTGGVDNGGEAPSGDFLGPSTGSDEPPVVPPDEPEPPGGDGGGNGGGGNGGNGGGGNGGGGNGGNGGGGNGGNADGTMPGQSENNPFGGPPSKLGLTPAHGQGPGKSNHVERHAPPKHGHKR